MSLKASAPTPPARIDDAGLEALEANACPGAGACGGQFTANTMAMSGEILGISPIQLSGVPATCKDKHAATREAGRILMDAVRANRRPSQIITRKSIENTIASVAASGGSTNAVLHLLAIAREMGIQLSIDDFDVITKRTPFICDLTPAGKYRRLGLPGRRRLAPARQAPHRCRPRRRLHAHHQRQDARRRSRARQRDARPGRHSHL